MSYYKAREINVKPFIVWDYVAKDLEEIIELDLFEDPLVVIRTFIPPQEFGVYNLKIVDGELVERSAGELEAFEAEYNLKNKLSAQAATVKVVDSSFFVYDSKNFPMDAGSRLFYSAIEKLGGNQKLMTTTGELYNLLDSGSNYTNFFNAYYSKLRILTQPDV